MTALSPFNVRSPVFFVEGSQAGHKIKNIGLRRVATGMIFFGRLDDEFYDGWKTPAATAAFFHGVVYLCRHDKLPTVLVEHLIDDVADVLVSDVITAANEHDSLPV
jgi:hypothetical protein